MIFNEIAARFTYDMFTRMYAGESPDVIGYNEVHTNPRDIHNYQTYIKPIALDIDTDTDAVLVLSKLNNRRGMYVRNIENRIDNMMPAPL